MKKQEIKAVKEEKINNKNRYEITFQNDKKIVLEGKGELKTTVNV